MSVVAGCANQLPVQTINSMAIDRDQVARDYVVKTMGDSATFIEQPAPRFSVTDHEFTRVTTFNVTKKMKVYTPYQAGREVYEVPGGIVMTAGGAVLSIADVLPFFGMLPDAITSDLLANGVAGINPFMNIESARRSESSQIGKADREAIDEKIEKNQQPVKQLDVTVVLDGKSTVFTTDEHGTLTVDLLSMVDEAMTPSELTISIVNRAGDVITHDYTLTRQLSVRLLQARRLLAKYEAIDTASFELGQAVKDMATLSRWDFEQRARDLETHIRSQLDEDVRASFDSQLVADLAG